MEVILDKGTIPMLNKDVLNRCKEILSTLICFVTKKKDQIFSYTFMKIFIEMEKAVKLRNKNKATGHNDK